MNLIRHNAKKFIAAIGLLVMCSSMLVACGGSGSGEGSDTIAGIGGTGIVAGKITGFGSVHVNGGTFEIGTSQFDVDGDTGADQGSLAQGMVIALEVEIEKTQAAVTLAMRRWFSSAAARSQRYSCGQRCRTSTKRCQGSACGDGRWLAMQRSSAWTTIASIQGRAD